MGDETYLDAIKARVLAEAREAIDRDMAELNRLAAKYDLVVLPRDIAVAKQPTLGLDMKGLIASYKTHEGSGYSKLRYRTRLNYDSLFRRIAEDSGNERLAGLNAQNIQRLYDNWAMRGTAISRSLITMLRMLFGFGATILADHECERLSGVLHAMRFPMVEPRKEQLTRKQANDIRARAHERGWHSVALAQAFQFECGLGQKDVIGEWVPISEPGLGEIDERRGTKWQRGLRWQEIDANLILRHMTSNKSKEIEVDLRRAPMVMEELKRFPELPPGGAVITNEVTRQPFRAVEFRRRWRICANEVGVPKDVFNMDSRPTPEKAQRHPQERGEESERTRPIRS